MPGRELNTADTLSRAPSSEVDGRDDDFHKEVNAFMNFSGLTTIGAGRAVAPPLFDGSKLQINARMATYSIQRQYSLRLQ